MPIGAELVNSGVPRKTRELDKKQTRCLLIRSESKNIPYPQSYCIEPEIITKQGCTCLRLVVLGTVYLKSDYRSTFL